jgi:hypothetical protein
MGPLIAAGLRAVAPAAGRAAGGAAARGSVSLGASENGILNTLSRQVGTHAATSAVNNAAYEIDSRSDQN